MGSYQSGRKAITCAFLYSSSALTYGIETENWGKYQKSADMEDSETLLPRFLRFVRGVIDTDDMPLNVSREILQNKKLETIRIFHKKF